jgi:hypothetical protein
MIEQSLTVIVGNPFPLECGVLKLYDQLEGNTESTIKVLLALILTTKSMVVLLINI